MASIVLEGQIWGIVLIVMGLFLQELLYPRLTTLRPGHLKTAFSWYRYAVSPPTSKQSIAQTLPWDILATILEYLDTPEAAVASMVCRSWLEPARQRLYYGIDLQPASNMNFIRLATSMENSPRLRQFVRRVRISVLGKDETAGRLDWIKNLPPDQVQRLSIGCTQYDTPSAADVRSIYQHPNIRSSVQCLKLSGRPFRHAEVPVKNLEFAKFEDLEVEVTSDDNMDYCSSLRFPALRKLVIRGARIPRH
ncbi:hypothetical protein DACRYDRAFT_21599 [Dacryopinax primogenitus]|uniref:F-box domain-containing protein n=1 Tax=Dacryopinax primogenitus (strain DJM 731) TaxID=1858805 RepID=M5GEN3_DACPD|nr:uncharacterized protein DACRYDRAFT_21599 [Dacryopinax primogenitus]EJU03418.1 hypothetical protein DACRYDRAFT_21599 [Dacryopinax primogenitus]